ncbi:MAG: LytTR family DNA-binding domain-containing protein [Chitinophagales bacterium]
MKHLTLFVLSADTDFIAAITKYCESHYHGMIGLKQSENLDSAKLSFLEELPDVLLLDADLKNAFQLLQDYPIIPFEWICVSQSKKHAFDAARNGVFDYWLKPLSDQQLDATFKSIMLRVQNRKWELLGSMLQEMRETTVRPKRVALHTEKGTRLVVPDDIIYCQADNNYTHVILASGEKLLLSQTLKKYEEQMAPYGFLRTHQTYLVNPKHIVSVTRGRYATITLSNLHTAGVAQSQRAAISEWLKKNS